MQIVQKSGARRTSRRRLSPDIFKNPLSGRGNLFGARGLGGLDPQSILGRQRFRSCSQLRAFQIRAHHLVALHGFLSLLGERAGEKVWKEALDKRKDQDMTERSHGDDQNDRKWNQCENISRGSTKHSNLAARKRRAKRSFAQKLPCIPKVASDELEAAHVELPSHLGLLQRCAQQLPDFGSIKALCIEIAVKSQARLEVENVICEHAKLVVLHQSHVALRNENTKLSNAEIKLTKLYREKALLHDVIPRFGLPTLRFKINIYSLHFKL
mmetsp:Transcript_13643/g.36632  ORF Transcript_13643/g.36632 Transcript_13643/m.36632 type:complete len:269 (-) Transcript_13643:1013-1819(-)